MCVVRKPIIGLTGRFKTSPLTIRQFSSSAFNLPRNLYKCLFHLYPFPHTWMYLQMQDSACMHFIDYLSIFFYLPTTANYACPLGALVTQFRLSESAQKWALLCIPLRSCSDSLSLLLKASGELLTVHFESSPMSNNGKPPPNLHVSLWDKRQEAHTDVKGEGEDKENMFENGVASE